MKDIANVIDTIHYTPICACFIALLLINTFWTRPPGQSVFDQTLIEILTRCGTVISMKNMKTDFN